MPKYNYDSIKIFDLVEKPERHVHYPSCQRDFVWSLEQQQKLINSILLGTVIPPIIIMESGVDESLLGYTSYIIDGQQRIQTIINFHQDKFKTAKILRSESVVSPVEPGKTFSELSNMNKMAFLNTRIQACYVSDCSDQNIGYMFRSLQSIDKLKIAEILWSYDCDAKRQAKIISEHSFWQSIYMGKKARKKVFEISLLLMILELFGGRCNLKTSKMIELVSGRIERRLDKNLYKTVCKRLGDAEYMFGDSLSVKKKYHVILLYQAVLHLDNDGCSFKKSKRACLTKWFEKILIEMSSEDKFARASDGTSALINFDAQNLFWNEYYNDLLSNTGVVLLDKTRLFNESEKFTAWVNQNGKCFVCHKRISTSSDGHHIIPHSYGGKTSIDNCALVCKECHSVKTAEEMQPQLFT